MPEHLTVNQGVTGSSPVGGAKLKEPRLARGSFNLIPPSEPESAILSRNSQQPVGRLTGLDRFSGLNLHLDALLVRTNGLIQGVQRSPTCHKGSCNARSFCFAFSFRTRTCVTLARQSAASRAADAHFDVSAKRNAVAPTASQSDISPARGRNGLIHRVFNASPILHKRIVQRTVLLFCLSPTEPEPVSLSRDSQQPVGRLTHTLTFPRSGMRSLRPQVKVMVQTRFASLNRLITGCHWFKFSRGSHQDATKKQLSEKPLYFKGFLLFSEQK